MLLDYPITHQYIETNGIVLHVVEAGPEDGPLVVLLHGFPEFWWGWRLQIPALATAGYRVVAPDQRGFFLSQKPTGVKNYQLPVLATDVAGLVGAYGYDQARIVGHDWGAAVAWQSALMFPQLVKQLAVLNVPHPIAMRETLRSDARQLAKSWYVFAIQLRGVAEKVAAANNWYVMAENVRASGRADVFTDDVLAVYRRAWSVPGAMRSMMNWYRAAFTSVEAGFTDPVVQPRTLILWGKEDRFLESSMAELSLTYCRDGSLVYFDSVSHWIQHEAADEVNTRLLAFFAV